MWMLIILYKNTQHMFLFFLLFSHTITQMEIWFPSNFCKFIADLWTVRWWAQDECWYGEAHPTISPCHLQVRAEDGDSYLMAESQIIECRCDGCWCRHSAGSRIANLCQTETLNAIWHNSNLQLLELWKQQWREYKTNHTIVIHFSVSSRSVYVIRNYKMDCTATAWLSLLYDKVSL